jgi:hypothetical protein
MECTRIAIDQTIILALSIFAHPAKTPFPQGNSASLGTEFTLDLSAAKSTVVGRVPCLDEALLSHLRPHRFWETEERDGGKGTETRPTKLQKVPLRHEVFGDPLTLVAVSRIGLGEWIFGQLAHEIFCW